MTMFDSKHEGSSPSGSGNPPFHHENGLPIFEKLTTHHLEERAQRSDEAAYKASQARLQQRTLQTQIILVVFGLLGTGVSIYQAYTSRINANAAASAATTADRTLSEMQHGSGAADTHMLAVQAGNQAKETTTLAKAARKQADQMESLAQMTRSEAQATNALAASTTESARTAREALETQVTLDRAFVSVRLGTLVRYSQEYAAFTLTLENTGGTAAVNVNYGVTSLAYYVFTHEPQDVAKQIESGKRHFFSRVQVPEIPPGRSTENLTIYSFPETHQYLDFRDVRNSESAAYLTGTVEYEDLFGGKQSQNFCIQISRAAYGEANKADNFKLGFCPAGQNRLEITKSNKQ